MRARLASASSLSTRAPRVVSDARLTPLLKNISQQYLGKDYGTAVKILDRVTPAMIDSLARTSMPLCMSNLHGALRAQHASSKSGSMRRARDASTGFAKGAPRTTHRSIFAC